jgi:hypothetical protein
MVISAFAALDLKQNALEPPAPASNTQSSSALITLSTFTHNLKEKWNNLTNTPSLANTTMMVFSKDSDVDTGYSAQRTKSRFTFCIYPTTPTVEATSAWEYYIKDLENSTAAKKVHSLTNEQMQALIGKGRYELKTTEKTDIQYYVLGTAQKTAFFAFEKAAAEQDYVPPFVPRPVGK